MICRSDTAALPKVSRVVPTNSIEQERLGGVPQPREVGRNADFSPMSVVAKSTFDCETARLRHPDG